MVDDHPHGQLSDDSGYVCGDNPDLRNGKNREEQVSYTEPDGSQLPFRNIEYSENISIPEEQDDEE